MRLRTIQAALLSETDQLGPLGKSWADAVVSVPTEGSTGTPSDGDIATAAVEGIAKAMKKKGQSVGYRKRR